MASIFLSFEKAIEGSATSKGHDKWIPLDSAQMGVARMIEDATQTGDRNPGTPQFSEIQCTMSADKASTELFFQAAVGAELGLATIHFVQTSGTAAHKPYLIWELGNALISNFDISASGDDHPVMSFGLNYTTFKQQYNQYTDASAPEDGTPKGWDLRAGEELA